MGNSKNMNLGILQSINKKSDSNTINENNSNDSSVNKNNSNNDTVNDNINNDNNNNNNISNDKNKNIDRNVSNSSNGNIIGNIVINKPITGDKTKRVSYYLKEKTITDIEKLAKKSGMGISEFLQYFLDITLDKIEIR